MIGSLFALASREDSASFLPTVSLAAMSMAIPIAIQERCVWQEARGRCQRGPAPCLQGSEGVVLRGSASAQTWGIVAVATVGLSLIAIAETFGMPTPLTVITLGLGALTILRAGTGLMGLRREGVLLTLSGFEVRSGGRLTVVVWDKLRELRAAPFDAAALVITADGIESKDLVYPPLPGTVPIRAGEFFLYTERLPVDRDALVRILTHFVDNPRDRAVLATELALSRIASMAHSTGTGS